MNKEMSLPPFYDLVRLLAIAGAVMGCIAGAVSVLGSLGAFQYSAFMGFTAMFGGVMTILGSLAGLGVAFCLLAIVRATIDTRNATVRYAAGAMHANTSTEWLAGKNEPTL